jgi:hypothetical protein
MIRAMMLAADALTALRTFRADLYACGTQRRDALFDLVDALLTADTVPSPVHLSLAPAHRRGWGSLYAALADGRLDVPALRALLARHPLADDQPIYAVDCSTWPRCDAETSPDRGYYYHPSRHSAGQPIVAGWSYSWLAQLSFARDSWTAPLDVQRVHPTAVAEAVAVEQITRVVAHLPANGPVPLFVFDAGNDPIKLALGLADTRAAILVRLRGDRCFYAAPPPPDPAGCRRAGRPRRHGAKFACEDPATWPAPTAEHVAEDGQYGPVRVRAWGGLHAAPQNHHGRGSYGPRPIVPGTVVLVEVSRLPRPTRPPKRLWLWWSGPGEPDPALLWQAYVRRFDIEHTLRFAKQTLLWTAPRPRLPEQADRWTWLVIAAYTQLRLARGLVGERRLPWERPRPPAQLTPARVRRVIIVLLALLGTPASPPKPCGRSPGRPKGRRSGPAPRHPALKKAA